MFLRSSATQASPRNGSGAPSRLPKAEAFGVSALMALMLLMPASALANTLVLKSSPSDGDGRITVGDVFDNAGSHANVVIGYRNGATAVLDAATVQMLTTRNGLYWDNPRGVRRIIVTEGADGGSDPFAAAMPATPERPVPAQVAAPSAPVRKAAVVKRSEPVKVTWATRGMALTVTGIATKDASIGDAVQLQNPTSKKMIDAVITGPGEALAGPAADQFRSRQLLSAR